MRISIYEYCINDFIFIARFASLVAVMGIIASCAPPGTPTPTVSPTAPPVTPTPLATSTPTPTVSPYPWSDQNAIMDGLCFESVYDAAGETFILRGHRDLTHFYDLADNSRLCRQPVTRKTFDFDSGAILAGTWSRGRGCGAHHEVQNVRRDDTARTLFIFLRLVTVGDCNYELVQPFWISLNGLTDYEIQFVVDTPVAQDEESGGA